LAVSSLESGSLSFRYFGDLGLRLAYAEGESGGEREEEGDDLPHRSLECGSEKEVKIQYNALWLVMIIEDRVGVVNRNHG
jgi:hypothetical protein